MNLYDDRGIVSLAEALKLAGAVALAWMLALCIFLPIAWAIWG